MVKFLKNPENLLVAIPLLFLGIEKIWFSGTVMDVHLHDTMYVLERSIFIWVLILLMSGFFMMHAFLRTRKWRSKTLCNIHVFGTAILLLVIGIGLVLRDPGPMDHSFHYADSGEYTLRYERFIYLLMISIILLLLFQILFFIHFLVIIIKKAVVFQTPN